MWPDSLCMDETLERRIWNGGERLKSFIKNNRANFPDEAKIVTVC